MRNILKFSLLSTLLCTISIIFSSGYSVETNEDEIDFNIYKQKESDEELIRKVENILHSDHKILQDKENGNYKLLLMQPVDVGGYKAGEVVTITITGVSKAQLSCIVNDSKMTSMTRQDIF